jgi:hypothetical protein
MQVLVRVVETLGNEYGWSIKVREQDFEKGCGEGVAMGE